MSVATYLISFSLIPPRILQYFPRRSPLRRFQPQHRSNQLAHFNEVLLREAVFLLFVKVHLLKPALQLRILPEISPLCFLHGPLGWVPALWRFVSGFVQHLTDRRCRNCHNDVKRWLASFELEKLVTAVTFYLCYD